MAISNMLPAVPSQLLTNDGGVNGILVVASTLGIVEGQRIQLSATSQPTVQVEVKNVINTTNFVVGPTNSEFNAIFDASAYTLARSASILAVQQMKPTLDIQTISNAEYQGGAIAGARTILVDVNGDFITTTNPLPTNTSVSITGPISISGALQANMWDGSGSFGITSQANGAQRAMDVGIDVAGVQVDPRQIRGLVSSDIVTVVQPTGSNLHMVIDSGSISLPSGAATSALQTTGNSFLSTLSANLPAKGQAVMAASMPVTIASDQSAVPVSVASLPLPSGGSTAALQTTGNSFLSTIAANIPAQGQALAAASMPVVLTAAQLSTLTPLSTVAATQSGTWNITNISGTISLPTGASTSALQSTGNTSLASIDTKTPALGQTTMAASSPVTIASNQSNLPVNLFDGAGLALQSNVSVGTVRTLNTQVTGSQADLLGRARIADTLTLFESFFSNGLQPNLWNQSLTGSATIVFSANTASAQIACTTGATDAAIFQSKGYIRYVAGASFQLTYSGAFGTGNKANVTSQWGYYDSQDGMFFRNTSAGMFVVSRTSTSGSPVDTAIAQASWNLDKLDGTGTSGATLVPTNHTLYVVEFLWHGAGLIRWGVYIGGQVVYCHQIMKGSVSVVPFWRSPSKPVRVELFNTAGTGSTTTINFVCCSFKRESSSFEATTLAFSASNQATVKSTTTTLIPLLSLSPAATFNSVTNRVPIVPFAAQILNTNGANLIIYYQVLLNATLTGASFVTAGSNSAANFDVSASAVSGGTKISEGYINSASVGQIDLTPFNAMLNLGLDIAGVNSDMLTIAVRSVSGTFNTAASMDWQEFQ